VKTLDPAAVLQACDRAVERAWAQADTGEALDVLHQNREYGVEAEEDFAAASAGCEAAYKTGHTL
jgi:hypothetical protein